MIYLASPYSHPDSTVREERYQEALKCAVALAGSCGVPYSPIVHWHVAAKLHKLPTDAEFWKYQNKVMLELATSVTVLRLPGWESSAGVAQELTWANERKLKVVFIDPENYAHRF